MLRMLIQSTNKLTYVIECIGPYSAVHTQTHTHVRAHVSSSLRAHVFCACFVRRRCGPQGWGIGREANVPVIIWRALRLLLVAESRLNESLCCASACAWMLHRRRRPHQHTAAHSGVEDRDERRRAAAANAPKWGSFAICHPEWFVCLWCVRARALHKIQRQIVQQTNKTGQHNEYKNSGLSFTPRCRCV